MRSTIQHRATAVAAKTAAVATLGLLALVAVAGAAQAAPVLDVDVSHSPSSVFRGDEYMTYQVQLANSGDAPTSAATTVVVTAPEGVKAVSGTGSGWTCFYAAQSCTYDNTSPVGAGQNFPALTLGVSLDADVVPDSIVALLTAFGGGAASSATGQDILTLGPTLQFGLTSFTAGASDQSGLDYTQAGGHPFTATTTFNLARRATAPSTAPRPAPVEAARDAAINLPPGFVANPLAVKGGCTVAEVQNSICPDRYAVGRADIDVGLDDFSRSPVYKVISEKGYPAEFAVRPVDIGTIAVVLRSKVRPGDFGITALAPIAPQYVALREVKFFTFCGYGAKVTSGGGGIPPVSDRCKDSSDPDALPVPVLTNQTECDGQQPVTTIDIASWEHRGEKLSDGRPDLSDPDWKSYEDLSPAITGCDQVPFDPSVVSVPTTITPDSASGLTFDLDVPQDGLLDHEGVASSHLKKTVVQLPEGLSVNPSAATGLEGCSDAQVDLSSNDPALCPEGAKIGKVEVTSPLVDDELLGDLYLATPKSTDPASGEMLRLFLVVRNDDLGILLKVPGSAVADPATGRLTATFDNNPRLPFDHLRVLLKGGDRGVLATPQDCGVKTTETNLTPWSGTGAVDRPSDTDIQGDCSEKFAPKLEAGSSNGTGRGKGGIYSFKFSRQDGEQWLRGLTAKLPQGLLASVKDVPLCTNSAADAGACPADSKIGIVDAKAGVGDPFVLEQKGEVFLTEGYKGGEYGLAVKIRPVAGPFRGDMELSPILVRQALHVDRTTAQVTAISDPFPLIHHGIPLRAREVNVLVNRSGFMLNPSDCAPKQTSASLLSAEGTTSNQTDPFQVSGCANLPFKPSLKLALTGKRQVTTGKHPGIKATVTQQGTSEAGIEQAVVRLPKSLALDPENAQALCEFADGTKPDLENHCPAGSIVGRARAKTPLLKDDLAGNVYFVKNIRIDPTTGNEIRTLPMIVVALRGEIAINLKGESSTTKSGKLVNTFANVPDAPISQFNLNIQGGNTGIIAVTRTRKAKINLCTGRHTAETDIDAQNGRRRDFDVRMKTPCTKKQTKAAKRQAKRAAARARN